MILILASYKMSLTFTVVPVSLGISCLLLNWEAGFLALLAEFKLTSLAKETLDGNCGVTQFIFTNHSP